MPGSRRQRNADDASTSSSIRTTHPDVVAEFHPSELARTSPTKLSSNSEMLVDFVCANEHTYRATIYDRVRGKLPGVHPQRQR
ncbi:zinc-ribbon domain-containing protein [Leifsonia soli]|uniref:zinc-ribbon domain-containing protein n=1 Tax=Leifsonia soli TaxID=582665 RepID=UPI003CCDC264